MSKFWPRELASGRENDLKRALCWPHESYDSVNYSNTQVPVLSCITSLSTDNYFHNQTYQINEDSKTINTDQRPRSRVNLTTHLSTGHLLIHTKRWSWSMRRQAKSTALGLETLQWILAPQLSTVWPWAREINCPLSFSIWKEGIHGVHGCWDVWKR